MFHDELMKDEAELKQWHDVYGRLAASVDLSLKMFVKVLKAAEAKTYATGDDFHAVSLMMLYEFADSIDGVISLVRVGSSRNCSLGLRTALEISLGVQYILEDAGLKRQRSLAYEYFHLLDGLKWAQKCSPDHPHGRQLWKELEGDQLANMFDMSDKNIDVNKEIENKEKLTNSSRYSDVRAEIDRIKEEARKAKKEDRPVSDWAGNWYSLWGGPRDLRTMAKRLKVLSAYEVLYRTWSNTAHGEGAMKRIAGKAEGGAVNFDPLRNPAQLQDRCFHAAFMALGLIRTMIDSTVPDMRAEFQGWYAEQMKPALVYIQKVKIKG